ncbi:unnamed protein product [Vicia faba]|uniref:Uncharacterized protein n=1 Tax=Vicia faba TaxID=3906 RepID=A0AAV0ZC95_VICFA|nr:unnamed protein product [Vicia faba]
MMCKKIILNEVSNVVKDILEELNNGVKDKLDGISELGEESNEEGITVVKQDFVVDGTNELNHGVDEGLKCNRQEDEEVERLECNPEEDVGFDFNEIVDKGLDCNQEENDRLGCNQEEDVVFGFYQKVDEERDCI